MNTPMFDFKRTAIILMAVFFMMIVAGCTEIERQGYSPIPQNSPGAWEMNHFGY